MIFVAILVLFVTSACFAVPDKTVCVTVCQNTTWPHFRYSSSRAIGMSTTVDAKNGTTGKRRAFIAPTSCGSCCTDTPHDDKKKHTQFNNTTKNKERTRSTRNDSNDQGSSSEPATTTASSSTLGYIATALTFAFAYVLKSTSFKFSDMWGIVAVALFVKSILKCCNSRRRNQTLDSGSDRERFQIHLHQTINVHHIHESVRGESKDGAKHDAAPAEHVSASAKEKCLVLVNLKNGEASTMANSD